MPGILHNICTCAYYCVSFAKCFYRLKFFQSESDDEIDTLCLGAAIQKPLHGCGVHFVKVGVTADVQASTTNILLRMTMCLLVVTVSFFICNFLLLIRHSLLHFYGNLLIAQSHLLTL